MREFEISDSLYIKKDNSNLFKQVIKTNFIAHTQKGNGKIIKRKMKER